TEVERKADLMHSLHPYLKDRLIGEIHVRIDAPASDVLEHATAVRERAETEYLGRLLQQVQEYAGAEGRGTIGLPETLKALNEQKVHILLVQEGFTHAGATCEHCGLLFAEQRQTCPGCNEPATAVDDVVELAVQRALELGSAVEVATDFQALK